MGRRTAFYIAKFTEIVNNLQQDGVDPKVINTLLSTTRKRIADTGNDTSQLPGIWHGHFKSKVSELKDERLIARLPDVYQTHDIDQIIEMTKVPGLEELSQYVRMQDVIYAGSAAMCGKFTACLGVKTANESIVDALDHVIAARRGPQARIQQPEQIRMR